MLQTEIRPRSVFCIVGEAYRNREVAERVAAGRFTHAGVTLDLGLEPDWLSSDFPADGEWRIEWSKFYYGLDLACAFDETGDEKYLRAWERLVLSWINQVPHALDPSDVTGRRIQNWIYAWDRFASSENFAGFTAGFEDRILASLNAQAQHLRSHLTGERNHRTLELYALFIASLALPELDADGSLMDFALTELQRNLLEDVRPDGVHRESSTHYHMVVLRSHLGLCMNARRFGLPLREEFRERLERACEFAMHCHRPDGSIPALSDSDAGDYRDLLELAAELFGRRDFLYVASKGAQGAAPQKTNVSFPDGGYYIQRSGWGADGSPLSEARYLIFDCGPVGDGGHGHYDLLSVEVASHGRPLIVDPGRYTYSEHGEVNWRHWFKGTAAHNTVCVDGLDQTPYRSGKPRGETARGQLRERRSAPGLDILVGEATSPAYEVLHTRRIFFVGGEYWLIADELRGDCPHTFNLRFHLAPEAQDGTSVERGVANTIVSAPGLHLIFEASRAPRTEQGWFAPLYGVKTPAPVISVKTSGVTAASFFTLIVPRSLNDVAAPTFLAHADMTGEVKTIRAEIKGVGREGDCLDTLTWNTAPQPFDFGSVRGCASSVWLRTSPVGKSLAFAACDVLELRGGAFGRVNSLTGPINWAAWDERAGHTSDERGAR